MVQDVQKTFPAFMALYHGDGVYVPIGVSQEYWRDFPLCKYIPPVIQSSPGSVLFSVFILFHDILAHFRTKLSAGKLTQISLIDGVESYKSCAAAIIKSM